MVDDIADVIADDIADGVDVDSSIITERDMRVDHDDFKPASDSRIARESPTSSHATEEDSP